MCCILIRHMTVYAKTPIFKRFLKMSNLLETWRQQSAHNIIVDTEADDNGDDADNEMFEAAMPFVIIRGNINGQIRHGISCPAFQSKKGNLSNLSSPPPPPTPNLHHYYCLQHMGHVTSHVLDFPSSLSRYEQHWCVATHLPARMHHCQLAVRPCKTSLGIDNLGPIRTAISVLCIHRCAHMA